MEKELRKELLRRNTEEFWQSFTKINNQYMSLLGSSYINNSYCFHVYFFYYMRSDNIKINACI